MKQEQMNYCHRLGFNWWQDTEGLNDYDFIITVDNEGNFKVSDNVEVKYISQYNILFWAHPHKLSAYAFEYAINKLNYADRIELKNYAKGYKQGLTKGLEIINSKD